ncbi:MAG: dockerin type I domain-containing protein [Candidatus Staskawiczbacteria bacterium]
MKKKVLIMGLVIVICLVSLSEVRAENPSEIDSATNYLASESVNPWITMALIAAGKPADLDYLKTASGNSATDYENIILAIAVGGENPKNFGNVDFVARLKDFYNNNQIGSVDLLNDDFWGILALVSAGEDLNNQIIQDSKNFILAKQNSDGGFPFGIGWGSDIDDTVAAISALLEAGVGTDDSAIIKAVDYLKANQNDDGGFPYDPVSPWGTDSNASSDSWVISVVNKLGENADGPSWSKNGASPVDHLLSLQTAGGYFEYQEGTGEDSFSPVTTSYAVIALSQKFYPVGKWSAPINSSGGSGVETHIINASADKGGLIFFSGVVIAGAGSDELFIITPDDGHHVSDVLIDGISVGAITSYTFTNISGNHTIEANFAADTPQPTPKSGDINGDNTVNENDFSALIEDWDQAGFGVADLNHDGSIDKYDFALLMLNWSI